MFLLVELLGGGSVALLLLGAVAFLDGEATAACVMQSRRQVHQMHAEADARVRGVYVAFGPMMTPAVRQAYQRRLWC